MFIITEGFNINQDFLPWLQRSDFTTSAGTFVFTLHFLHRVRSVDQHSLVGVAFNTSAQFAS